MTSRIIGYSFSGPRKERAISTTRSQGVEREQARFHEGTTRSWKTRCCYEILKIFVFIAENLFTLSKTRICGLYLPGINIVKDGVKRDDLKRVCGGYF